MPGYNATDLAGLACGERLVVTEPGRSCPNGRRRHIAARAGNASLSRGSSRPAFARSPSASAPVQTAAPARRRARRECLPVARFVQARVREVSVRFASGVALAPQAEYVRPGRRSQRRRRIGHIPGALH